MNNPIRWLRISYWTGAGIDLLAAIQMLVPAVFTAMNRLPDFHPGPECQSILPIRYSDVLMDEVFSYTFAKFFQFISNA